MANSYELSQQRLLALETAETVEDYLSEAFDLKSFADDLRDPRDTDVDFTVYERPIHIPKLPFFTGSFYGKPGDGIVPTRLEQLPMVGDFTAYDNREDLHQPGYNYKVNGARFAVLETLKANPATRVMATASAGGHGISLAVTVNELNKHLDSTLQREAHVYCRHDISPVKRARLEQLGARIYPHYETLEEAMEAVETLTARDPNQAYIHPFDSVLTIAGQATISLRRFAMLKSMGVDLGAHMEEYVPVGGGGLLAGTAIAWNMMRRWGVLSEHSRLYGVEIERNDSMARALDEREPLTPHVHGEAAGPDTLDTDADAIATLRPGSITAAVARQFTDGMRVVPKQYVVQACGELVAHRGGRIPELAGALSLAGLLHSVDHGEATPGAIQLTTTTGSNIAAELVRRLSDEWIDADQASERTRIAAQALRLALEQPEPVLDTRAISTVMSPVAASPLAMPSSRSDKPMHEAATGQDTSSTPAASPVPGPVAPLAPAPQPKQLDFPKARTLESMLRAPANAVESYRRGPRVF